jgi:glycyl-tRNA synthetase beta chain
VNGPSAQIAYKDGQPTPAAHAFAKKVGVDVGKLEKVSTPKGEYLAATVTRKGPHRRRDSRRDLPKEISTLYWPKNMYWRKRGEVFVRPVRWLVAMLDEQVVPLELFGIAAGKTSRGHRIIGKRGRRHLQAQRLCRSPARREGSGRGRARAGDPQSARRGDAHHPRRALARRQAAGRDRRQSDRFPSVILGSFDPEFLDLPEEVLVTVMRDHQKYFAIEDANGKLLPHFLAVLNTAADSDGLIRHGNERVLRARFNDARFFWQTDQKQTLRQRVDCCATSPSRKILAATTTRRCACSAWPVGLPRRSSRAAWRFAPAWFTKALLAKTDLTTELVKEFTELQGIVGGLYAPRAATRRRLEARRASAKFRGPSTITTSPSRWKTRSRNGRGRGSFHRRQGRLDRRNVCARSDSQRIERSVRAAPPGQRHREDDRRAQTAVPSFEIMADARVATRAPRRRRSSRTPPTPIRCAAFSASAWNFT